MGLHGGSRVPALRRWLPTLLPLRRIVGPDYIRHNCSFDIHLMDGLLLTYMCPQQQGAGAVVWAHLASLMSHTDG